MATNPSHPSPIRLLSVVEATNINAVARITLEFFRSARNLQQQFEGFPGVEGSIATFSRGHRDTGAPNEFVAAARAQGLAIDVIFERRRFDPSVIFKLRRVAGQRQPHLIATHSVKSHFLLWRSYLWRQYPWVAFHHGYTTTNRMVRLYNRLDRWSLPAADRLVTVCDAFARELAATTHVPLNRIAVQHNSIRLEPQAGAAEARSVRSALGIAEDERVVLAVGRLSKEKAHIDLIEAFKCLLTLNREFKCKLVIAGDGPEREKLEAAAGSLAVNDRVIFTGQIGDVRPFYAVASVLVIPSHSEGSPNVLLEAMAANLPVVATAVGGVPEMVDNNVSALLVPARHPEALAAAINRVLIETDLAQRLSANAYALAATRYSPEKYVRSVSAIYHDVIAARQMSVGRLTRSRP